MANDDGNECMVYSPLLMNRQQLDHLDELLPRMEDLRDEMTRVREELGNGVWNFDKLFPPDQDR